MIPALTVMHQCCLATKLLKAGTYYGAGQWVETSIDYKLAVPYI